MKNQRHKRKESFSVLLISNTDRSSKQYHVSLSALRLAGALVLVLCLAAGGLTYTAISNQKVQATLRTQLTEKEELISQMTTQKETLENEKQTIAAENDALKQEAEEAKAAAAEAIAEAEAALAAAEEPEEPQEDPAYPSRYPSSGASVLKSEYSQEQPYLSITTYSGCDIVAAGNGTVTAITSDDTYSQIIEVDHGNGYRTRYLCLQPAEVKTEEGAGVEMGAVLFTITTDETQLDYQVIYQEEPIDPLSVIDARG